MSFLDLFRRKKPPVVDLTNEAFGQWIRAQRPPFPWFMAQAREDREAMALIGDEHAARKAVQIGYAVASPEAEEAANKAIGGDVDGEADLVEMLARKAVQKILAGQPRPPQAAPQRPPQPPMQMRGTGRK